MSGKTFRFGGTRLAAPNDVLAWLRRQIGCLILLLGSIVPGISHAGVIAAAAGGTDEITFLLDDDGSVWALDGCGSKPTKVPGLDHIVSLAAYGAVRDDGKILTWTLSKQSVGCDPLMSDVTSEFDPPKILRRFENARSIVSARRYDIYYYLAVLKDGRVVEWEDDLQWGGGEGASQMALQREKRRMSGKEHPLLKPHIVPASHDVISVAAESGIAAFLTSNGELWGWGWTGFSPFGTKVSGPPTDISSDHAIRISIDPDYRVVFCSDTHLAVLTKDGTALFWGEYPGGPTAGSANPDTFVAGIPDPELCKIRLVITGITYYCDDGSIWDSSPPPTLRTPSVAFV